MNPTCEDRDDLHPEPLSPEQEAELARFAEEEARKLGLGRAQYQEPIHQTFTRSQKATTTLLVSGLSLAHDQLIGAALHGIGYRVDVLDVPDQTALSVGKEFGNRGQCNPTYFTVGNLVKHLINLREGGLSTQQIIDNYLFLTAGACGPCRFGMYVTEYRKALRDAGFDGFRVLLFQQQGGIKQATGEETGLPINGTFAFALLRAMLAGDVVNLLGYRLRPYEKVPGSVNKAIETTKSELRVAFANKKSVTLALRRARRHFDALEYDFLQARPKVSVIGEFWAMTTEGDGNYHLQKFLEQEGAEVDIQPIINWLLFMVWENRFDTLRRLDLKAHDEGRKGLAGKEPAKKLVGLAVADKALRAAFQTFAHAIGLTGYHLPDMDQIASLAHPHFDNQVRGGEAHMEVGKLLHFVQDRVNHMTISVKPFGCMPSSGVSDGVQTVVQSKYPDAVFLPIETTGDGAVNVQSRIQMMLFSARNRATAELSQTLQEKGWSIEATREKLAHSRFQRFSVRPRHQVAGSAANLVKAL